MPIVRLPARTLPAAKWKSLAEALRRERREPSSLGEPMIFEIVVEEPNKFEVLAIWSEWNDVSSVDRTNIVMEAYDDQRDNIVQALGATYEEAIQEQLLPYRIVSVLDRPKKFLTLICPSAQAQTDLRNAIQRALLQEAGARQVGDKAELRFPTKGMAEQAQLRLIEKVPNGYWLVDSTSSFRSENA